MRIEISSLAKAYNRNYIFNDISWTMEKGYSNVITGPNGSGKSTLLRLLSCLEQPTKGKIEFYCDGQLLSLKKVKSSLGLLTPELNLYNNLTPRENLLFFASILGIDSQGKKVQELLEKVRLNKHSGKLVGTFSSGMKQRLKLGFALLHNPNFLFLDEPSSNLDEEGKKIVEDIILERREKGVVVIASNEPGEVESFGQRVLCLDPGNPCPGQKRSDR